MEITVQFTTSPIERPPAEFSDRAGAVAEFWGVVRAEENDRRIAGLVYEIYEPMADRQIRRILEELHASHPCLAAWVTHRHGIVPAGSPSIFVRICSKHRIAAFRVLEEFMNRLKIEVPIWKTGTC